MTNPPPRTPAESVAAMLWWLSHAVASRTAAGLAMSIIGPIIDRIRGIKQRFARLAARIEAGTYTPRRSGTRRPSASRHPRPSSKLPQHFGWLLPLVPEATCARAQLEHLFRDPEMVALMQAAPASMARVLRPLCWMLRVTPPPVLALPARPRPPREPPPIPAPGEPPPPPPSPTPRVRAPRGERWSLARICGPPLPA